MSVQAMSWVFDYSEAKHGARLVLIAMANHHNSMTGAIFPSVDLLAREARLSKTGTLKAIDELEREGHISVHRPETYGRGRFNRYVILGYEEMVNAGDQSAKVHGFKGSGTPGCTEKPRRSDHSSARVDRFVRLDDEIPPCPLGLCNGRGYIDTGAGEARRCECAA